MLKYPTRRLIAVAAAAAVTSSPVALLAAQQGDATTISWSGATFMRSFTTSRGISKLDPNSEIFLNSGPGGSVVRYKAGTGAGVDIQLAAQNVLSGVDANPLASDPAPTGVKNYYGVRFEWHEQGSIEGIQELINDQIGTVATVSLINRNGSSGNPTWVNSNPFGQNGVNVIPAPPTFSTITVNGHNLATSNYNAAFGGNYNDTDPLRRGRNTQGGQNRVQQAVSDVASVQGFSLNGAPSFNRLPGTAGYGLGNPSLRLAAPGDLQGIGKAGVRHQFNDSDIANMKTTNVDPATGLNYAAGPWNSAGDGNLFNTTVAVGGMAYVANPGTGLSRLNRTDNIWLHTTGRLQNGADFNVVTRDVNSGTVNSATNNLGLDTTWAVGENDDGNSISLADRRIGPGIKFSGKTSGGQAVRPTVQNSRMAFGHLSSSDAIPNSTNGSSRPMRVLDYRDDGDDLGNGSNNLIPAALRNNAAYADPITGNDADGDIINGFTRLSAKSIVFGTYESRTNQTYVTVKAPRVDLLNAFNLANPGATDAQRVAWWSSLNDNPATPEYLRPGAPAHVAGTGIKGDNSGNDVWDFRQNILNSLGTFPSTSTANPADTLLSLAYLLPQFSKYTKDFDGLNRDVLNPGYRGDEEIVPGGGVTFIEAFLTSGLSTPFNAGNPNLTTTGSASAVYGGAETVPVGGQIPINNRNYLFGDFDQRATGPGVSGKGIRDFSDLDVARRAQAALFAAGQGVDWNVNAASNATVVVNNASALATEMNVTLNGNFTKGDLIVLGDFDSDGDFDGEDLRRMARGTTLADTTSTGVLTAQTSTRTNVDSSTYTYTEDFGDMVRRGTLRKNAALDQLHTGPNAASAQQKVDARAVVKTQAGTARPAGSTLISTTGSGPTLVETYTNDPAGVNAYDKFDVNRDGKISRLDAQLVDHFVTADTRNMQNQLDAVARIKATGELMAFVNEFNGLPLDPKDAANDLIPRAPISLIDIELNDDNVINHINAAISDFKLIRDKLGTSSLQPGDSNFDGTVSIDDFNALAANYGATGRKWSQGDFANYDGLINIDDFNALAANYGLSASGGAFDPTAADWAALQAAAGAVPEPGSLAVAALAGLGLLARRRRNA